MKLHLIRTPFRQSATTGQRGHARNHITREITSEPRPTRAPIKVSEQLQWLFPFPLVCLTDKVGGWLYGIPLIRPACCSAGALSPKPATGDGEYTYLATSSHQSTHMARWQVVERCRAG